MWSITVESQNELFIMHHPHPGLWRFPHRNFPTQSLNVSHFPNNLNSSMFITRLVWGSSFARRLHNLYPLGKIANRIFELLELLSANRSSQPLQVDCTTAWYLLCRFGIQTSRNYPIHGWVNYYCLYKHLVTPWVTTRNDVLVLVHHFAEIELKCPSTTIIPCEITDEKKAWIDC